MVSAISTSVSDAILALSAFYSIYLVKGCCAVSQIGFFMIGVAAMLGIFRFGFEQPHAQLLWAHKTMSWLAKVLGMAFISAGYCQKANIPLVYQLLLSVSCSIVIANRFLQRSVLETASELVSIFSVMVMLVTNAIYFNPHGLLGAFGYVVAGVIIGTEGHIKGIPRVDLFHYACFVANIALALGLASRPQLVYYRRSS